MSAYEFKEIESKWQKIWEDNSEYKITARDSRPKYYCLVMFPYPSGNLHMGHVRNYVLGDLFARYYRMKGYQVLQPVGWDGFGLPAENAAIKNNINPETWTRQNIQQMKAQLKSLGISYDWSRELATCDQEYYKWNQWFFIEMWKKGLAFRKKSKVNWCPSCQTVLANEQVNQGLCWRCDSSVKDRELEQWFLKITEYADELLESHAALEKNWPGEVLSMQKNWIGKSTGAEVKFSIESPEGDFKSDIRVFTTRPDTLFGATFMVMAPEHDLIKAMGSRILNREKIDNYISESRRKSNIERISEKVKTGIRIEGIFAVNPVNKKKIPVFIADYVLAEYGTGAIMAVPAHDQRDWEFAKAFGVPVIEVIHSNGADLSAGAFEGEGKMVNSDKFNGLNSSECIDEIIQWLQSESLGEKKVNFKLKDWLISRQRYWGTPIPMIHCDKCGVVPTPEKDLPVKLPSLFQLSGNGKSPLASSPEFVNTICPKCGEKARRETDTMDTFVDSAWYYARYCDPRNSEMPFLMNSADSWLPVDQYIGGIEHACMHLIYSRFWHKIMRDLKLLNCDEPFTRLLTQGMVTLGGSAMSKSKGNVVSQNEIVNKYGADTARLFILFAAPPVKQLEWSSDGVEGSWRFINRVWRLVEKLNSNYKLSNDENAKKEAECKLLRSIHLTVKKVTSDIEVEQQLNTAIASIMELVNDIYSYPFPGDNTFKNAFKTVVQLLYPFTPHVASEIWKNSGEQSELNKTKWPVWDEKYIHEDNIELPVQINGKLRGKIVVPEKINSKDLRLRIDNENIFESYLKNKEIIKFIYVQNKILNIVVK